MWDHALYCSSYWNKNNYWAKNILFITAESLLYRVLLCIELPPYYIMLLVLNWSNPALDVNKVKYNDKYLCEKIPLMSLSCDLVSVHGPNKSIYLINSICPFRLYVLFSQCRSCDDLRKCFFCVFQLFMHIFTHEWEKIERNGCLPLTGTWAN